MVKVRFAPSPTGHLHVGNTRTALMNYLFARNKNGRFILRIEDTDVERSDAMYETSIIDDLKWFGIKWDEGPFRQSDRLDIYRSYVKILLDKNAAYKCFCSKDALEQMRKVSLGKGEPPKYNGTCRELLGSTIEQYEKEGRPYVVRFKSLEKPISFKDEIHGEIHFPRDHVDDFIVLKQGGTPSYNFAVTIDDMLMGITHVIRGADHISNTPKQIMLFLAFGEKPPQYAHHSLLTGDDKKPLSKRHGVTRVREFRDMGILKSAFMNYLGILGRNVKKEILEEGELIETFSLNSLSSSDSLFDMGKLLWFNKEYIRRVPVENMLVELGLPLDYRDRIAILKDNAKTLNEMKGLLDIFDSTDIKEDGLTYLLHIKELKDILPYLREVLMNKSGATLLEDILQALERKTTLAKRELLMMLRILCTGRKSGPPLKEVFQLIPKDIIIKRMECAEKRFSLQ